MRIRSLHKIGASANASPSRGATLVEFTLVFGIFLLILFSLIDITRYLAAYAIVTKGAQIGLSTATQALGFEEDIRGTTASDARYIKVENIRSRVIRDALSLPTQSLVGTSTEGGLIHLTPYNIFDPIRQFRDPATGSSNVDVVVLRPGELAYDIGKTAASVGGGGPADQYVCHPTLWPSSATANADKCVPVVAGRIPPRITSAMTWMEIMRSHPLYVQMRVEIEPIIPWPIPTPFVVYGRATGFRELARLTKVPPEMGLPNLVPITTTSTSSVSTVGGGGY